MKRDAAGHDEGDYIGETTCEGMADPPGPIGAGDTNDDASDQGSDEGTR